MTKNKEWFASWFDTRYYHILYKHRDDTEAHEFIQNLVSFLSKLGYKPDTTGISFFITDLLWDDKINNLLITRCPTGIILKVRSQSKVPRVDKTWILV